MEGIKVAYADDPWFEDALNDDQWFEDALNTAGLDRADGYYYSADRIVVPAVGSLRTDCVRLYHAAPYIGHVGRDKTLKHVTRVSWWPGVAADVARVVQTCPSCQRVKPSRRAC